MFSFKNRFIFYGKSPRLNLGEFLKSGEQQTSMNVTNVHFADPNEDLGSNEGAEPQKPRGVTPWLEGVTSPCEHKDPADWKRYCTNHLWKMFFMKCFDKIFWTFWQGFLKLSGIVLQQSDISFEKIWHN